MTYPLANTMAQWFATAYPGTAYPAVEKIVWHTTEGGSWPDYRGGAIAPHYTCRPDFAGKRLEWRAHFPDLVNSRALVNLTGGVQTNLDGALQVEVVGTCDPSASWAGVATLRSWALPDWVIDGLARFAAWAYTEHGVPLVGDVPAWRAYPASYGRTASQRFSAPRWDAFRGHCGHQHVPENEHGDPGAFMIGPILARAQELVTPTPPAPPEENDMQASDPLRILMPYQKSLLAEPDGVITIGDLWVTQAAQTVGIANAVAALSKQVPQLALAQAQANATAAASNAAVLAALAALPAAIAEAVAALLPTPPPPSPPSPPAPSPGMAAGEPVD